MVAKGKYVCFVDSDDFFKKEFVKDFLEICEKEDLDIIRGWYGIYEEDTNGIVLPDVEQDVAMVSVLERFGRNGNKSLAFCSGWKLKKGAMASSAAPDDNNLVVMGVSAEDMSIAANYLIEQGGGQVVVADGEILEFLPLPVGGIVSDEEPEVITAQEKKIDQAARMLGSDLPDPMMYMFFLPITAIPDYAITDVGPVDYLALTTFDPVLEVNEK